MTSGTGATAPERRRIPGVDGMRGLAILMLIGGHYALRLPVENAIISGLPSYSIVVLFVLAGFVVTRGVLEERDWQGRIRLGRWLVRKGVRTYPTLVAILAATTLVQQVLGNNPVPLERYLGFLSLLGNYYYALAQSDTYRHAIGHLWSLMVGAQFLLVWVLLLAHWPRERTGQLIPGLVALIIVSSVLRETLGYIIPVSEAYVYLSTETRAGELALGALAAVGLHLRPGISFRGSSGVGMLGLCVVPLVLAIAFRFPGSYLTQAVCTTLLMVLLVGSEGRRLATLLSSRPLAILSAMSYSIFSWHLYALEADRLVAALPTPVRFVTGLIIALIACAAAYLVLEWPVRRWMRRYPRFT